MSDINDINYLNQTNTIEIEQKIAIEEINQYINIRNLDAKRMKFKTNMKVIFPIKIHKDDIFIISLVQIASIKHVLYLGSPLDLHDFKEIYLNIGKDKIKYYIIIITLYSSDKKKKTFWYGDEVVNVYDLEDKYVTIKLKNIPDNHRGSSSRNYYDIIINQ